MAGQTINVSVLADTRKFGKAMGNLSKQSGFSKLGAAAKKVGKIAAVGIAAVGAAAVAWGKSTLDSLMRIEQIGAQTDAVLKSTGGAAGRTREQIDNLAGSIERMSGVEAEAVTEGQNLLLTFTNIKGQNFDRATQAMTDMAVAMNKGSLEGLDMSASSIQLGKALNDPVKGISALSRVGVGFTKQQEEQIRTMSAAGDTAGAQAIILAELEKQFGGSAEAAGKTAAGTFAKVGNIFGEISERVLSFLLPAVQKLGDWLLKTGVPAFDRFGGWIETRVLPALREFGEWFRAEAVPRLKAFIAVLKRDVLPRLQELGKWITGTLVPALVGFGTWVVKNRDWLTALALTVGTIVLGIAAYVKVMAVWKAITIASTALQVAFNAVLAANPIGLIVLAIAALVAGLVYFFTQTDTGRKIWAGFTAALSKGWEAIKGAFSAGWNAVRNFLGKAWDFIKRVWSYSPLGLVVSNWGKITGAFSAGYTKVKGWLQRAWDFVKRVWSYSPIGLVTQNWGKITGWFSKLPGRLMKSIGSLGSRLVSPFKTAFNSIARLWNGTVGKLSFTAPSWIPGMGGKGWSVPNIPMLAQGGIATGPTLAMIGEGRESEAILPLSKLKALLGGDMGGRAHVYQISVTMGPTSDPVATGREITKAIAAYERANGGSRR